MMTVEEMHDLCHRIRSRSAAAGPNDDSIAVNAGLVARVEADVRAYRAEFYVAPVPQIPPAPLRALLRAMGWLIYEASLDRLWGVPTRFQALTGPAGGDAGDAVELIQRLVVAARLLV